MDRKLSLHLDAIHAEEQRIQEMPPGVERTQRIVRLGYYRRKLQGKIPTGGTE